jgi:hypothetical protein
MTTDYGAMLRNRSIETRYGLCLQPSLTWDRNLIAKAAAPDSDALAALDEQIRATTVVVVLRALTEDESWALDQRYASAKQGTPEARNLDKSVLLKSFVRFETMDGDEIPDLGKKDFGAYWDNASPGERMPLLALSLELKVFQPSVPFSVPQSLTTRP